MDLWEEGLLPHFFVFDFLCNFHLDSMKILLEVLRFFPLLNLGGNFFEKNVQAGRHVTSKLHESNYCSQMSSYISLFLIFAKLGTFVHSVVNSNLEKI